MKELLGAVPRLWRRTGRIVLLAAALVLAVWISWPALAAVELAYFRATSTATMVTLEWATQREVNIAGFEVQCKIAHQADSAYHPIGSRIAQGAADRGAAYTFEVRSGPTFVFGQSYCFRIVEVTTDQTPGERFDICGYGPGVTPTPVGAAAADMLATPTPILLVQPPDAPPAPTLVLITPTVDPFISPLVTPVQQQGTDPFDSPLPPPQSSQPLDDQQANAANFDQQATPTELDNLPRPEAGNEMGPATETPTPAEVGASNSGSGGMGASDVAMIATATPMFVVVTATPTPEALAVAPTFTPWPTVVATPSITLLSYLAPTSQNMMVMLLCLLFLGASGLGTLGLVASVIYMRSRGQRERYWERHYGRRRIL
jgi:hypothetical protein